MTTLRILSLAGLLILVLFAACSEDAVAPPGADEGIAVVPVACSPQRAGHATGEVQLVWKGGNGAGAPDDTTRVAYADFAVHTADGGQPDKGTFVFRVVSGDGTLHREVTAAVTGAVIDPTVGRVWFVAVVTADSKGCDGGPGGGHADGCGDDGGTGCSDGHDDGHDGGCSGDHDEGGCTGGGDTGGGDTGGCPDGTHDDGGCPEGSHDTGGGDTGGCPDGTHDDGGCPEGSHDTGGSGGPTGASGRYCRVGQVVVAKGHDGGTPGVTADGITWKWFLADDPDLPSIDDLEAWPHLCKKTITGGNLVVHAVRPDGAGRIVEID